MALEGAGGEARVRVRDTGIGIAPDVLGRVREPSVPGTSSLDRPEGWLGIGLTLVKMLVERHRGQVVACCDNPGAGSELVVTMPALRAGPEAEETMHQEQTASSTTGLRVMIVEDNLDAAESLAVLLGLDGHEVRVAGNGPAALELAASWVPDVALVDIGLPGLDGYQVATRLRTLDPWRGTMLVALSGYGRAEDKQRAMAAGFDRHMTKPVEVDALTGLLAGLSRGLQEAARLLQ